MYLNMSESEILQKIDSALSEKSEAQSPLQSTRMISMLIKRFIGELKPRLLSSVTAEEIRAGSPRVSDILGEMRLRDQGLAYGTFMAVLDLVAKLLQKENTDNKWAADSLL